MTPCSTEAIVLSGQCLSWIDTRAGVPQGSISEPILLSVYFTDLSKSFKTNICFDTSSFSWVRNINPCGSDINKSVQSFAKNIGKIAQANKKL